jgi:hypothetical protein
MKFDDIISDIAKLVGLRLSSIRPGSDITLTGVDLKNGTLELMDSSNNRRSRSLTEIRKIWEQLCVNKVVHVDSALGGSGSSRNQPETIIANLPYVEWLIVGGKKHISFVGRNTHPFGSLKKMDSIAAQIIASNSKSSEPTYPVAIIVSNNLRLFSDFLEAHSGLQAVGVSPGVYSFTHSSGSLWLVSHTTFGGRLPCGVFLTVSTKSIPKQADEVLISGLRFYLISAEGVEILLFED